MLIAMKFYKECLNVNVKQINIISLTRSKKYDNN